MHNKLMRHAWGAPLSGVSRPAPGAVAFLLGSAFRPNTAFERHGFAATPAWGIAHFVRSTHARVSLNSAPLGLVYQLHQ
jgi:hypothetical protein